ncbi:MAG: hypothetical protein FWF72_01725 [Paludibacter sp.]|nr:hypothetical protein [Paludibacter sp.]
MKNINELVAAANEKKTKKEVYEFFYEIEDELIDDVKNSFPKLIDFNRRRTGYGTWIITSFVNQYHFGEWSELLKGFHFTTHNEDYSDENFLVDIEKYINYNLADFVLSQEDSQW